MSASARAMMERQVMYSKRAQSFSSAPLSVLVMLSLGFSVTTSPVQASSDLMSGMSAYQAKDYRAARTYFQRLSNQRLKTRLLIIIWATPY